MSIFDPKKFPPRFQTFLKAGDSIELTEEELYVKFAGVASGDYLLTDFGIHAETDIVCEWRGEEERMLAQLWYWNLDSEAAGTQAETLAEEPSEQVAILSLTA